MSYHAGERARKTTVTGPRVIVSGNFDTFTHSDDGIARRMPVTYPMLRENSPSFA